MTLYLPVGPPGCGKTLLSLELVRQGFISDSAPVSTDEMRRYMTGTTTDQSANEAVWSVARTVAHERLERGLTVYFDATNLNPEWYDKLLAKALDKKHEVLFILFDTPYADCRRHNIGRKESAIPDTAVERMINTHRKITPQTLRLLGGDVITGSNPRDLIVAIRAWRDNDLSAT